MKIMQLAAAAIVAMALPASAQGVDPKSCTTIGNDKERLACFDASVKGKASVASNVTAACEERLLSQLKAPSTYRRIKITDLQEPVALEAYKDEELIRIRDSYDADTAVMMRRLLNLRMEAIAAEGSAPTLFTRTIEYDAQNGFGALLRGRAQCSYVSGNGREDNASAALVTVDIR